ncbi:MAG: hypothetical protein VXW38_15710 [Bacteroidota bacterium]|uniref:PIN domain-containing protein n=2 Tax=Flagellimonas TaxID=444459 RepID=A0A1M6XEZ5_9FLAO|nr:MULTISPECIES: hypothetical protein [Allomuricauda]MBW8201907.1 hypothetical protein [Allomuricauda abyssi]MEC7265186.1 hypothetical protein [Bacteroidota bacterium]SFB95428.1 hypothetical protein SAMN04487891_10454 [Allomuricauda taeanensis]SHL04385.1 hypothetical protein SAMN05216293_2548 [Allomuricauda taeanensis]
MYTFSDIELLLVLDTLKIFEASKDAFYVTEMVLESNCYSQTERIRLNRMVEEGKIMTFSLEKDFYRFSCKQSIPFPGLHLMDLAAIYHCKLTNGILVERNELIKECAETNGVKALPVNEILNTIVKEQKVMDYIRSL